MIERLHMGAGGDFRHHAAESRVFAHLAEDDVGQDFAAPVFGALDHRRRGLVAGRLDAEDDHLLLRPSLFRGARFYLRMILSENRYPLFGIMRYKVA